MKVRLQYKFGESGDQWSELHDVELGEDLTLEVTDEDQCVEIRIVEVVFP